MGEPHKPKLTDYLNRGLGQEPDRGGASEPPREAETFEG